MEDGRGGSMQNPGELACLQMGHWKSKSIQITDIYIYIYKLLDDFLCSVG